MRYKEARREMTKNKLFLIAFMLLIAAVARLMIYLDNIDLQTTSIENEVVETYEKNINHYITLTREEIGLRPRGEVGDMLYSIFSEIKQLRKEIRYRRAGKVEVRGGF